MMSLFEKQQSEIATIREHTFELELSDADVRRICERAGSVGLTASELLQSFIGDLVDGTYSNGSDEREYAEQWFDRCGFSHCADDTFLRYLIEHDLTDEILAQWDDLQSAKEELACSTEHSDDVAYLEENIKDLTESINCRFSDFKQTDKENQSGTLENEMRKVVKWYSYLGKAME